MEDNLSVHERIIRAAGRDKGLRLTADEVWRLAQDEAIKGAAVEDGLRRDEEALAQKESPECKTLGFFFFLRSRALAYKLFIFSAYFIDTSG